MIIISEQLQRMINVVIDSYIQKHSIASDFLNFFDFSDFVSSQDEDDFDNVENVGNNSR